MNAPLICCNGGLIVEPTTCQVLHMQLMPLPLAHELLHLAKKQSIAMLVSFDDLHSELEYRPSKPGCWLRRDGVIVRSVGDPIAEVARPPLKVTVFLETPRSASAVVARLQEHMGDRARILASSPHTVEVVVPGTSKAWAMSWLAQYLGIGPQQTVAIGDGENDIEMLGWAGLGIAMGNAVPAVQAAADWIAPPVEEDRVAVALRRFVLESRGLQ